MIAPRLVRHLTALFVLSKHEIEQGARFANPYCIQNCIVLSTARTNLT